MWKITLLLLAVTGLHAMPLRDDAEGLLRSQAAVPVEFCRQGTQPSRAHLVDLKTGLLTNHVNEMDRRVGDIYVPPSNDQFRQGTQNSQAVLVDKKTGLMINPVGEMKRTYGHVYVPPSLDEFRQGTQNSQATVVDLRTGEVVKPLGEMRRGYELSGLHAMPLRDDPEGLLRSQAAVPVEFRRQGTQPSRAHLVDLKTGLLINYVNEMDRRVGDMYVPPSLDEFRQGTQNSRATVVDLRTGEVVKPLGEMRRGYELSGEAAEKLHPAGAEAKCQGEVINDKCYRFFPSPQIFSEAESVCKQLSPSGHLASVTSPDLHARLVFMVTEASNGPVLTWLGGVLQADQLQWTDGSGWNYSDWMPGQPKTERDSQKCLEMFKIDERWWNAADCGLKRAFICSYSITE